MSTSNRLAAALAYRPETAYCPACKQRKPIADFAPTAVNCHQCHARWARSWRARNPTQARAVVRRWQHRHPDRLRSSVRTYRARIRAEEQAEDLTYQEQRRAA